MVTQEDWVKKIGTLDRETGEYKFDFLRAAVNLAELEDRIKKIEDRLFWQKYRPD